MEPDLIDLLAAHTLHIDVENQEFASNFVNIQGFKKTKSKERILMSTWLDGYLFSLWVGIKINRRKKDFKSIEKYRSIINRKQQYIYLISMILSKKEVLIELNLESIDAIKESNVNSKQLSDKLKLICDEFAFGGLDYLKELFNENEDIFDDPSFFDEVYKKIKVS